MQQFKYCWPLHAHEVVGYINEDTNMMFPWQHKVAGIAHITIKIHRMALMNNLCKRQSAVIYVVQHKKRITVAIHSTESKPKY